MFLTGRWKRLVKYIVAISSGIVILITISAVLWFDEILEFGRMRLVNHGIHLTLPISVDLTKKNLHMSGLSFDPGVQINSLFFEWGTLFRHDLLKRPFQQIELRGLDLTVKQEPDMAWKIPGLNTENILNLSSTSTVRRPPQPVPALDTLLESLPVIIISDSSFLLESQTTTYQLYINKLHIRSDEDPIKVSLIGQLQIKQPEAISLVTNIKATSWLDTRKEEIAKLEVTLSNLSAQQSNPPYKLRVPYLNAVAQHLHYNSMADRLEANQINVVVEGLSLFGRELVGMFSELDTNLELDDVKLPWPPSSHKEPLNKLSMANGKIDIIGLYQNDESDSAEIHVWGDLQNFSILHQTGKYQLNAEANIHTPALLNPHIASLNISGDLQANKSDNFSFQLIRKSGDYENQLVKFDVQLPPLPPLINFFRQKDPYRIPIDTSLKINIQSPEHIPFGDLIPERFSPIQAELTSKVQLGLQNNGLQISAKTETNIEMIDCNAQMELDSDFQGNFLKGIFKLHSNDMEAAIHLNCDEQNWGGLSTSGQLTLTQIEDRPLAELKWDNGDFTAGFALNTIISKPLVLGSLETDDEKLAASGSLLISGITTSSETQILVDTDISLDMRKENTHITTLITGAVTAVLDPYDEEISVGTDSGLNVELDGYFPKGSFTNPARLRVTNGTNGWLLKNREGHTQLDLAIQSDGPRLDASLAGTRIVVRQDDLTVHLKKNPLELFAADIIIKNLLLPEQDITAKNITSSVNIDTTTMCTHDTHLEIELIRDSAINRRFPDMSLMSHIDTVSGRTKGQSELTSSSGKNSPLIFHVDMDTTCDGREGKLLFSTKNHKLSPQDINIKSMFPISSQWIESLSGQFDFNSSLIWDETRNSPILDSRVQLRSFEIDMAPLPFLDKGVSLVGGELLFFSHIPTNSPENGSITTHMDGINIESPQLSLSGLQGLDVLIEPIWPLDTVKPVTITFDELTGFLPFSNGTVSLSVTKGKQLTIHDLHMQLGNGLVTVQPSSIDFKAESNNIYLHAADINLSALRNQLQISLKDNLDVDGTVHGTLPIQFSQDRIQLIDATFRSDGPGFIRYNPLETSDFQKSRGNIYYDMNLKDKDSDVSPSIQDSDFTETLALNTFHTALANLHFDKFSAVLNGDLGRALTINLQALGANPDMLWGVPIDLTLEIETELAKLFSAFNPSIGSTERSFYIAD